MNPFLTPRRWKRKYVPVAYYRTHILEAIREEDIVCLECGGLFRALPSHLKLRHHLLSEDYKAKWGYNRTTGLSCQDLSEQSRTRLIALRAAGRVPLSPPPPGHRATVGTRPGHRWRTEAKLRRKVSPRAHALYRRLRKVSDEVLIQLAQEGLNLGEIAARTELSRSGVCMRLAKLRREGRLPPATAELYNPSYRKVSDEELLLLIGQGLTKTEILERKKISWETFYKRVERLQARGLLPPDSRIGVKWAHRKVTGKELLLLRAQGLSHRAIAKRKGLTRGAVQKRFRKLRASGHLSAASRAKTDVEAVTG